MIHSLTLVVVASFAVNAFAANASQPAPAEPAGMIRIFNGNDLAGWDGDPRLWSVKDGAIHGETSAERPTTGNTFLIWKGGATKDFELRLSFRSSAANNSGIQYRSKRITDVKVRNKWGVRGYQHEIRNEVALPSVSGFIYDEGGNRGRICLVGEKATWQDDGKKQVTGKLIDAEEFKRLFKLDGWNDVVIIARGNRIQHYLNNRLILDFTDNDPRLALREGVLALQLHAGKPFWVEFKDIRIKTIRSIGTATPQDSKLQRLKYNHPGLAVDLGAGLWAWPLPMDVNGDGRIDMIINEEDVPYNGVYVYEHPGTQDKMPVFKPARRLGDGMINVQVSYVDGKPRVLTPGREYPDFIHSGLSKPVQLPLAANVHPNKVRGNMWRYVDFDGDDKTDLVIGIDDWTDYGEPWTGYNAYNASGKWLRGPLRGQVYVARHVGTNEQPRYATPYRLTDVRGGILETYGWPSPSVADWDGDGDLDILCGDFLNRFTYFQNVGSRTSPRYAGGVRLKQANGTPLEMDMQMITPVALDWDHDGDLDLLCGEENGRVALVENTGRLGDAMPLFRGPAYFQQEADELKCGALATPCAADWDADGDWDVVCGNSAGYIVFFQNLSGPGVEHPKWAAPVRLQAAGKTIRIQAGPNGSIQGPGEACFGYTVQTVSDWDGDGLLDIVANSIWGKVIWYKNVGTAARPKLAAAQPIEVEWDGPQPALAWGWVRPEGKRLLTQWRTTPVTVDWNKDGLTDLVMLDQEGYLALFPRAKGGNALKLLAPQRVFCSADGKPLQLNSRTAGASGRRKLCVVDLDGDGALDFLVNSSNASWLRQKECRGGKWYFEDRGAVDSRRLAGHSTCPTAVDFDNNGIPDILIGAEDGHFYYRRNPRADKP